MWEGSQMCGRLFATSSLMYFSSLAIPVYRCCGDSITGGGKNLIRSGCSGWLWGCVMHFLPGAICAFIF